MKRTPLKRGTKALKRTPFKTNTAPRHKKSTKRLLGTKKGGAKTQAKLKKDLDTIFSRFIRQKYADENGMVRCYTCSTTKHWKEMQNGHWIPRNYLATRFSENNCRVQCVSCNVFHGGRPDEFAVNLLREGVDIVSMMQSKHEVFKIDRHWYEAKIAYYKNLVVE